MEEDAEEEEEVEEVKLTKSNKKLTKDSRRLFIMEMQNGKENSKELQVTWHLGIFWHRGVASADRLLVSPP